LKEVELYAQSQTKIIMEKLLDKQNQLIESSEKLKEQLRKSEERLKKLEERGRVSHIILADLIGFNAATGPTEYEWSMLRVRLPELSKFLRDSLDKKHGRNPTQGHLSDPPKWNESARREHMVHTNPRGLPNMLNLNIPKSVSRQTSYKKPNLAVMAKVNRIILPLDQAVSN